MIWPLVKKYILKAVILPSDLYVTAPPTCDRQGTFASGAIEATALVTTELERPTGTECHP